MNQKQRLSPKSSLRSSMSDFTDTTISTWNQRHQPNTEYPSVLSDRLKTLDRDRLNPYPRRIDFDTSNLSPRDPCTSYEANVYRSVIQNRMDTLSDQLTKVLSTGAGSSHINGSLADSGIQTDNTSTSVPQIYLADAQTSYTPVILTPTPVKILKDAAVDTRNENNLQDIPFIDDDDDGLPKRRSNVLEKHKSMSNIPERIDESSSESHERLSSSLNRARSPTFVDKFKKFFVDIGFVKPAENLPVDGSKTAATLPKSQSYRQVAKRASPAQSMDLSRVTATLPKDMRFRKVISTQTVYIKPATPVLTRNQETQSRHQQTDSKDHVSVVQVNGSETFASENSRSEVVFVNTISKAEIYAGNDSGSTIIIVPPAD